MSNDAKTHVLVKQGKYYPSSWPNSAFADSHIDTANPRHKHFSLRNKVTVIGGFTGSEAGIIPQGDTSTTVLSGNLEWTTDPSDTNKTDNVFHVFWHPRYLNLNDTAKLVNVTVTGGNANGAAVYEMPGGGIYNSYSSPDLTNCTVSGNTALAGGGTYNDCSNSSLTNCTISGNSSDNGGGIYNSYCSPVLTNCMILGNTAVHNGGGIYNDSGSSSLVNCTISSNTAVQGGGVYNNGGNSSLNNCIISENTATGDGGGILNNNNNSSLTNCTILNNTASLGGGVRNSVNVSVTENCIFSGNTAVHGGGLYNNMILSPLTATMINCTFSENTATGDGGGIFNNLSDNSSMMTNCTFSGNIAAYGAGICNILSSPVLINCTISGNTAATYCGGMYNITSSTPKLYGVLIAGNTKSGGTIRDEITNDWSSRVLVDTNNFVGQADTDLSKIFKTLVNGKPVLEDNGGGIPTLMVNVNPGIAGVRLDSVPTKASWDNRDIPVKDQRGLTRNGTKFYIGAMDPDPQL